MSIKTIKDPTFNVYKSGGSVDKRMEGRGDLKQKDKLMKLAKDEQDIIFDIEMEITGALNQAYNKEKKPGQSFSDWLKSKPKDYLRKIPLQMADGGKVIFLTDYLKQKRKQQIKKIDLAQGDFFKTVAGLSEGDKKLIKDLLRRSGVLVGD